MKTAITRRPDRVSLSRIQHLLVTRGATPKRAYRIEDLRRFSASFVRPRILPGSRHRSVYCVAAWTAGASSRGHRSSRLRACADAHTTLCVLRTGERACTRTVFFFFGRSHFRARFTRLSAPSVTTYLTSLATNNFYPTRRRNRNFVKSCQLELEAGHWTLDSSINKRNRFGNLLSHLRDLHSQ